MTGGPSLTDDQGDASGSATRSPQAPFAPGSPARAWCSFTSSCDTPISASTLTRHFSLHVLVLSCPSDTSHVTEGPHRPRAPSVCVLTCAENLLSHQAHCEAPGGHKFWGVAYSNHCSV